MTTAESLQKLFRYELLDPNPIGRGGCGHIWRARDLLYDKPVALKTISESLRWDHPDRANRTFRKEAMACARLAEVTPYVVPVFDIGTVDGILFYVMNWIQPEAGFHSIDLNERAGRLGLAAVRGILLQVSEAIGIAHSKGIVHSDIAPANILYDHDNRIYRLADFGLLKIVEEELVSRGSGSLLTGGRLDFLPDEARQNARAISYASDVYALAVTVRVLLEGHSCLPGCGGHLLPTPGVVRVAYEQRDAPDQVRQLLKRFLDGHTVRDTVDDFRAMLHKIPN